MSAAIRVGRIKVRVRNTRTGSAFFREADPATHFMRALDPPYIAFQERAS